VQDGSLMPSSKTVSIWFITTVSNFGLCSLRALKRASATRGPTLSIPSATSRDICPVLCRFAFR
jgi:hypothetical protein